MMRFTIRPIVLIFWVAGPLIGESIAAHQGEESSHNFAENRQKQQSKGVLGADIKDAKQKKSAGQLSHKKCTDKNLEEIEKYLEELTQISQDIQFSWSCTQDAFFHFLCTAETQFSNLPFSTLRVLGIVSIGSMALYQTLRKNLRPSLEERLEKLQKMDKALILEMQDIVGEDTVLSPHMTPQITVSYAILRRLKSARKNAAQALKNFKKARVKSEKKDLQINVSISQAKKNQKFSRKLEHTIWKALKSKKADNYYVGKSQDISLAIQKALITGKKRLTKKMRQLWADWCQKSSRRKAISALKGTTFLTAFTCSLIFGGLKVLPFILVIQGGVYVGKKAYRYHKKEETQKLVRELSDKMKIYLTDEEKKTIDQQVFKVLERLRSAATTEEKRAIFMSALNENKKATANNWKNTRALLKVIAEPGKGLYKNSKPFFKEKWQKVQSAKLFQQIFSKQE